MTLWQRWKQTSLPNKLLVETGALVAFGTLFYAGPAAVQVCLMRQAARDAAAQVERLSNAADEAIKKAVEASSQSLDKSLAQNKASFEAALTQERTAFKASADQAKASLDASTKAAQGTLRPYIHVASMDMLGTVAEGQRFQGQANVINSGRTPGIHVTVCADVLIRESTFSLPDNFPCPAPGNPAELPGIIHSEGVIGPNSPPVIVRSRGTTMTPQNQPGTLIPLLNSRTLTLYFYGDITYTELLNQHSTHHTEFCGVYRTETRMFDGCEHHNNVD